jgi:hypothetical protein
MSIARSFWYWRNAKGGPKDCVLVFQDGSYEEIDLRDFSPVHETADDLNRAIGCGFKKPADGKWRVEFLVGPNHYRASNDCDDVKEVACTVLSEIKKFEDDQKLLTDHPEVELERLLKGFDWTFEFSDDSRVWSNGHKNLTRIRELQKTVSVEISEDLWRKYAPNGV